MAKVNGDGAYTILSVFELLEGRDVEPVVKPRSNSKSDTDRRGGGEPWKSTGASATAGEPGSPTTGDDGP